MTVLDNKIIILQVLSTEIEVFAHAFDPFAPVT